MSFRNRATTAFVGACGLAAVIGAVLATSVQDRPYQSRGVLSDPLSLLTGSELRGRQFAIPVAFARTAESLDPPLLPAEVRQRVSLSRTTPDGRRTVTAVAPRPSEAQALADKFMEQYISQRAGAVAAEVRLRRAVLHLTFSTHPDRRVREQAKARLRRLRATALAAPPARVSEPASFPTSPVSLNVWRKALIALGLGGLLGVLFRELVKRTRSGPGATAVEAT